MWKFEYLIKSTEGFIAETPKNISTAAHVKQRLGSMSAHANLEPETFLSINSLLAPVLNSPYVDIEQSNTVFIEMPLTCSYTTASQKSTHQNSMSCTQHGVVFQESFINSVCLIQL